MVEVLYKGSISTLAVQGIVLPLRLVADRVGQVEQVVVGIKIQGDDAAEASIVCVLRLSTS